MKSAEDVRQETAEVLGGAVAEVARRAIKPELDPFINKVDSLVVALEEHVGDLESQVEDEKKELARFNESLKVVTTSGRDQTEAVERARSEILALGQRLADLYAEVSSARDAQNKVVNAVELLRDEVSGWVGSSEAHAERLARSVEQGERLAGTLRDLTSNFTGLASDLKGRVDGHAKRVDSTVAQLRQTLIKEIAGLRSVMDARLDAQQSALVEVKDGLNSSLANKLDEGVGNAIGAVVESRRVLLQQAQEVSGAQAARVDGMGADLAREMTELRADSDAKLSVVKGDLRATLERLSHGQDDQSRALVRVGLTTRRLFQLAVVTAVCAVVALGLSGASLWMAVR